MKKLGKLEVAEKLAEMTGQTKKDAKKNVDAFLELISETLENGDSVSIVGFGAFEVKKQAARKGRNPNTGEELEIPETNRVSFKAGKTLKDRVN